ncbi:MAG: response regulator [Desulfosalsimonas sp.]
METLLIVDDDITTRHAISDRLQPYEDVSVQTALNGKAAVDILKEKQVDLILADSRQASDNGFLLLNHLRKHYPETPVFVIIDQDFPENESSLKQLGISRHFYKPLNLDVLIEAIVAELGAEGEGEIHCMSLPAVLQLVEMENKTCTLTITPEKGGRPGKLYFVQGELYAARVGDLEDEQAAYEILNWNRVSIFITSTCRVESKKITQSLMGILMGNGSENDEHTAQASEQEKANLSTAPEEPEVSSPETRYIIETLDKEESIHEYVLYDVNDRQIPVENARSEGFGPLAPSKFFQSMRRSRDAAGDGKNHFLLFYTKAGKQMVLFQFRDIRVIASLKAGCTMNRFLQNMHPLFAV